MPLRQVFDVCEIATLAHATSGIAGQILQFNEMRLEFRQQVAADLSSGCSRFRRIQSCLREAEAT
jgi:hypothetical protein